MHRCRCQLDRDLERHAALVVQAMDEIRGRARP
jgi:hypothetical protein